MQSSKDAFSVPKEEQIEQCKQTNKGNFKVMYEQKEYMEEYL